MSMFSESSVDDGIMNEINMTPLIDVMLVLLIIFIVTLPVMNNALKLDLPKAAATQSASTEQNVDVSITASGDIFWNKVAVNDAELAQKVASAAAEPTQPTIRIYADRTVAYDHVVHVLAAAQGAGLSKLDFVTTPDTKAPG